MWCEISSVSNLRGILQNGPTPHVRTSGNTLCPVSGTPKLQVLLLLLSPHTPHDLLFPNGLLFLRPPLSDRRALFSASCFALHFSFSHFALCMDDLSLYDPNYNHMRLPIRYPGARC